MNIKIENSQNSIPFPVIERLALLSAVLENLFKEGCSEITSTELEPILGIPAHTIRKDLNFLGQTGGRRGYRTDDLLCLIKNKLGLNSEKKACIVGLGHLGSSFINHKGFLESGHRIVAGFDSSSNKIELLKTEIPLYPSYDMARIVKKEGIELGIITVPSSEAQAVLESLIAGGIKGVVNFSARILDSKDSGVLIRDVYVVKELTLLSALINQKNKGD